MFGTPSCAFDPAKDIPDLSGKVILVTGGNTGLGKQYILEICRHNPAQIWLAARNLDKARAAVDEIKQKVPDAAPIELLHLDLGSLSSVRDAAKTFTDKCGRLDILILNAGLMSLPKDVTTDGYEIQFGTNYLGHVLFTQLLMPLLQKTATAQGAAADVRIVVLTSWGHNISGAKGIDFDAIKTNGHTQWGIVRYGQSKLAQILWVRQLAKRYPNMKTCSVHPGMVSTELGKDRNSESAWLGVLRYISTKLVLDPVEKGVKNQLWASVAPNVVNGQYYEPIGIPGREGSHAKDEELSQKLWDWTVEELKKHEQV